MLRAGLEQESRQRELAEFCSRIEQELSANRPRVARDIAVKGGRKFPGDANLIRLKTAADAAIEREEQQAYIGNQIANASRLLEAGEAARALSILNEADRQYQTDTRLLEYLQVVRDAVAREKAARQKEQLLRNARSAMHTKDFAEAISVLEGAQVHFPDDSEIKDLLKTARDELDLLQKKRHFEQVSRQAHDLLQSRAHTDAIRLLERTVSQVSDPDLVNLLQYARQEAAKFRAGLQEASAQATQMLRAGQHTEALKYLEAKANIYGRNAEFQVLLEQTRKQVSDIERAKQRLLRNVEDARAMLRKHDLHGAQSILRVCETEFPQDIDVLELAVQVEEELKAEERRRQEAAERELRAQQEEERRRREAAEQEGRRRQAEAERALQLKQEEERRQREAAQRAKEEEERKQRQAALRAKQEQERRHKDAEERAREARGEEERNQREAALRTKQEQEHREREAAEALRKRQEEECKQKEAAERAQRAKEEEERRKKEAAERALERQREKERAEVARATDEGGKTRLDSPESVTSMLGGAAAKPTYDLSPPDGGSATRLFNTPARIEPTPSRAAAAAQTAVEAPRAVPKIAPEKIKPQASKKPKGVEVLPAPIVEEPTKPPPPQKRDQVIPVPPAEEPPSNKRWIIIAVAAVVVIAAIVVWLLIPSKAAEGVLKITGVPKGASYTIGGVTGKVADDGTATVPEKPGRYRVEVQAEGYESWSSGDVGVTAGSTKQVPVKMEQVPSGGTKVSETTGAEQEKKPEGKVVKTVTINADTDHFQIIVDGKAITPVSARGAQAKIQLSEGAHTIILKKQGYQSSAPQTVKITAKSEPKALIFALNELKPGIPPEAYLAIRTTPGAKVRLDDRQPTTLPYGIWTPKVSPGNHKIEVTLDGYYPRSGNVSVPSGDTASVNLELQPIPKPEPKILSFTAERPTVEAGKSVTLMWNVQDATTVIVEPLGGRFGPTDQVEDRPDKDTTYVLTAVGPGGRETEIRKVTVTRTSTKVAEGATDQLKIRDVLNAYKIALQDKDESELRRAWPKISDKQLKETRQFFGRMREISVSVQIVGEPEVNGNIAKATCKQKIRYTDVDSATPRDIDTTMAFTFRKLPSQEWVIEKAQ